MPQLSCYTCGPRLQDALEGVRTYNALGVKTSLSHLPVKTTRPEKVQEEVEQYRAMLRGIEETRLDSDVTVKLHQFGIYGSYGLCRDAVREVIEEAHRLNNFVWIDMELGDTIDDTIRLYREMRGVTDQVGICLQAYHKRTEADMNGLLRDGAIIRLVKGFYKDSDFRRWSDVTANYERLMFRLLAEGTRPIIATHDLRLLDKALHYIRKHEPRNVEIQFAKNIRDQLAEELARQGFNVRLYFPFGDTTKFLIHGIWSFDKWRNLQRILARDVIR